MKVCLALMKIAICTHAVLKLFLEGIKMQHRQKKNSACHFCVELQNELYYIYLNFRAPSPSSTLLNLNDSHGVHGHCYIYKLTAILFLDHNLLTVSHDFYSLVFPADHSVALSSRHCLSSFLA